MLDTQGTHASPEQSIPPELPLPPLEFSAPAPLRLGNYILYEEIAHGGMGVVFRARQINLGREVALKLLLLGRYANAESVERFRREAEAAAALRHPHIVQMFDVGEIDGQPFLAMEYVRGRTLGEVLREGPLAPARAAKWMREVAEAIHYAHTCGVLHRDLKPSNLLIDADEQVRISDFGLARKLDGSSDLSVSGQMMGTPHYISPEQAAGRHAELGPASDVYALGAILYELLAGRPPFLSDSLQEVLLRIRDEDPVALRTLNPQIHPNLETICLKCLQKEPTRRYASAHELAEDLDSWLQHRPIQARPASLRERLWLWCRRRPAAAATTLALALLFSAGFAGVFTQWRRAEHHRAAAEASRHQAERSRDRALAGERTERWERYRANLGKAGIAIQSHTMGTARTALAAAPEEHRGWEWHYYFHQLDRSDRVLQGPLSPIHTTISKNGKVLHMRRPPLSAVVWNLETGESYTHSEAREEQLAIAQNGRLSAWRSGENHHVLIRDVTNNHLLREFIGHEAPIKTVVFSDDGARVASVGLDHTIRLWNIQSDQPALVLKGHSGLIDNLAFSQDGRWIASASRADQTARLWDTQANAPASTLLGGGYFHNILFNPQGDRILGIESHPKHQMVLWDRASGERLALLQGHEHHIQASEFSHDGSLIASCSHDRTVRIWDGRTGAAKAAWEAHRQRVLTLAFHEDGTRLVTGSRDQTVRLWEIPGGTALGILNGHSADVSVVRFSADGRSIISGSEDGTFRIWDLGLTEHNDVLKGHSSYVYSVSFHPDGDRLASAAWDGTVRIWESSTGQEITRINYPDGQFATSLAFHPGGHLLATAERGDAVCLWDVATGQEVQRFSVPLSINPDSQVAFSPRGDRMAAGDRHGLLHLWDVDKLSLLTSLPASNARVIGVIFSPDNTWMASSCEDATIQIWNLKTLENIRSLKHHALAIYRLAVSKDGRWLASASLDGSVRLWDTQNWQSTDPLPMGSQVYDVSFTPDGKRLAAALANGTIQFWDMATYQPVCELFGHTEYVHQIAFSPDGTRMVSGSGDFTVRIWDSLPARERRLRR